jgi:hypothetical protein
MDTLIVRPKNKEQLNAIKAVLKALKVDFVSKKEKNYNPEFVKKILKSKTQAKGGKVTKIDVENLWQ